MSNNNFIEKYIYINKSSLSKELCNIIIEIFEDEMNGKYEGVTAGGIIRDIKKTTDFIIPKELKDNNEITIKKWSKVQKILSEELDRNVNTYIKDLTDLLNLDEKEEQSKYNKILRN